jgi:hypothetical protein
VDGTRFGVAHHIFKSVRALVAHILRLLHDGPSSLHEAATTLGIAGAPFSEAGDCTVDWAILHSAGCRFSQAWAFIATMGGYLGDSTLAQFSAGTTRFRTRFPGTPRRNLAMLR